MHSTSIYINGASVCLLVCLYPINAKTADPSLFGPYLIQEIVMEIKWKKFAGIESCHLIFLKMLQFNPEL